MNCENCGKDVTGTFYDHHCSVCGRVRCSTESHFELMEKDEHAKEKKDADTSV